MILSFFLQLLFLYGMTLDCYATAPKAEKRDDVLPRALTPDPRCNMSIKPRTQGCTGELIERYAYNKETGKCVDYDVGEDCFQENVNEFETRLDCYEACNPNSACLEDDPPQLQRIHNRRNQLYYYDPVDDFCDETLPNIAEKNVWPKGNLFLSQALCIRECKPRHEVNGEDFFTDIGPCLWVRSFHKIISSLRIWMP
uniref:Putative tick kunitz 1 n=1 Tax=Amblyomma cajennense TaxID=34607 RepID=A0A023FTV6_AMBCJ